MWLAVSNWVAKRQQWRQVDMCAAASICRRRHPSSDTKILLVNLAMGAREVICAWMMGRHWQCRLRGDCQATVLLKSFH